MEKVKRENKYGLKLSNFIMLIIAGAINAVGVTLLLAPLNLYDSGISGLSMFIDMILPFETSMLWLFLIVLNFPIFLFGLKMQGVAFTIYSIFAITMYSLFAALYQNILPLFITFTEGESIIAGGEIILCAVFGGGLSGVGSGMTIRYGGALDGIEQLAVIFAKRLNLTVGNFVMIFNVILYIVIGAYFQSFILPLYSIVAYFVASKAVDFISQGLDQAKGALIITNHYDEVAAALSSEFGRGLTVLDAKGYYSNTHKSVIYCVVNRFQVAKLRNIIAATDKRAFVTIMEIADVFGTSVKYSRADDKKRRRKLKEQKAEHKAEIKAERLQKREEQISINEFLTDGNKK